MFVKGSSVRSYHPAVLVLPFYSISRCRGIISRGLFLRTRSHSKAASNKPTFAEYGMEMKGRRRKGHRLHLPMRSAITRDATSPSCICDPSGKAGVRVVRRSNQVQSQGWVSVEARVRWKAMRMGFWNDARQPAQHRFATELSQVRTVARALKRPPLSPPIGPVFPAP